MYSAVHYVKINILLYILLALCTTNDWKLALHTYMRVHIQICDAHRKSVDRQNRRHNDELIAVSSCSESGSSAALSINCNWRCRNIMMPKLKYFWKYRCQQVWYNNQYVICKQSLLVEVSLGCVLTVMYRIAVISLLITVHVLCILKVLTY